MEIEKNNRRLRFTSDDDIEFLQLVVAHNPIQNPERWEIVQTNLERLTSKKFLIRTLKQHLQLLLQLWMAKDKICKIRSGEEEPYTEKDVLLQEISIICNEANAFQTKRKVISKEKRIAELGKQAREKFAVSFSEDINKDGVPTDEKFPLENMEVIIVGHDYSGLQNPMETVSQEERVSETDPLQPSAAGPSGIDTNQVVGRRISQSDVGKRPENAENTNSSRNILTPARRKLNNKSKPLRKDALSYLNEKHDKENKIKIKELELEERKIRIEERKIELEERRLALQERKNDCENIERTEKMELEKERLQLELSERKLTNNLLESQQKLINSLLKNFVGN